MTQKDTGGPAYPHQFEDIHGHPRWHQSQGMTLRDYFAGQAMVANIAALENASTVDEAANMVAEVSYKMADAMIAARKETT